MNEKDREGATITIKSVIEELEKAKSDFEKAVKNNEAATLTEYHEKDRNVFLCKLGAIPADHEVKCNFTYHMPLRMANVSFNFYNALI